MVAPNSPESGGCVVDIVSSTNLIEIRKVQQFLARTC